MYSNNGFKRPWPGYGEWEVPFRPTARRSKHPIQEPFDGDVLGEELDAVTPIEPVEPRKIHVREAEPRPPTPVRPPTVLRQGPVRQGPVRQEPGWPQEREARVHVRREEDKDERTRLREALLELEAAKDRIAREAERELQSKRAELLGRLLPVIDNLDRSIQAAANTSDSALLDGIKLVRAQLEDVLVGYGVERMQSVGKRFDPVSHDAIATKRVDSLEQDGIVTDEWEAGYRVGEKVLRAAKVRVGKYTNGQ